MSSIIGGPHFITTRPNLIDCRTCRRPVLAATVAGLDRHIDPTPLLPAGELAALLAGRVTYYLAGPMADHLIRRNVHHIRGAQRELPIVADHHCTPPAAGHVDHTHLEKAAGLVRRLLGGHDIEEATGDDQPQY